MSPSNPSKPAQKSCYSRPPDFARWSNRRITVTRRTRFLLLWRRNTDDSNRLAKVTAVTFRPTSEGALALLRGSEVTCYLPRGFVVTGSKLPTYPRWHPRPPVGSLTARELFGLHPVPVRPAPNYSRLSRLDHTGLIWLLRGRPVIALTAAEAVMRCQSGATLAYRKLNKPALGPIGDSLDDVRVA
jgi:hypothetical protein